MFVLSAYGSEPRQRWRQALALGRTYVLGRDVESDLPVPWDPHVSRQHARLIVVGDHLQVNRLETARNPVLYDGKECDHFRVSAGEHFVIGTTVLSFAIASDSAPSGIGPLEEVTFDPQELQKIRFRDADRRFDVLTRLHEVIWGARTETEMHQRLAGLILAGVGNAEAVAIVDLDPCGAPRTLHWDRRHEAAGSFHASARLIEEALHRHRSILHIWEAAKMSDSQYTLSAEFDWAFCTPFSQGGAPLAIYVAGVLDQPFLAGQMLQADGLFLQADVKFTQLVAEIVSSVLRLNRFERQKSGLRQFFAPPILAALGDDLDTALLEPRECDVTVLFCDLRGFSQKAEAAAGDLHGLLNRVSRALGVMTSQILKHGGVTGDFQGDAAMGFWGWPLTSTDAPLAACRAALGICEAFSETSVRKDHPLAKFQVGIGIAHGRAVAGKIGTAEQVKVTVFGPVVNLASRLENMTKQLRVPIVIDAATAAIAKARLDPREGRVRTLGKVVPYGTETPVLVNELLPPAEASELTDEHVRLYNEAVENFIAGRWEEAYRRLHGIPAGDRAQDFLSMVIAQHNRIAPADWDGVLRLPSK